MVNEEQEEIPVAPPDRSGSGPLVPRSVITIVTLALVCTIAYSATQRDYRSMIVVGLILLFILGADIGAIIRGWRGGGR